MTDPVVTIEGVMRALRDLQRTLICRPVDEAAVREAVEHSPTPGLFSVVTSEHIPPGQVLIAKTSLVDPTPAELAEQIRPGLL